MRRNDLEQTSEMWTVQENNRQGKGVLSEQLETESYNSAGFKSGFASSFKDRQSEQAIRVKPQYR